MGYTLVDEIGVDHTLRCPHCEEHRTLRIYKMATQLGPMQLPSFRVYLCTGCEKFSRCESRWKRIFGLLFLTPFVMALVIGFGTGIFILGNMAVGSVDFDAGFATVGIILAGACGWAGWRTVRYACRLAFSDELSPLIGGYGQGSYHFGSQIE